MTVAEDYASLLSDLDTKKLELDILNRSVKEFSNILTPSEVQKKDFRKNKTFLIHAKKLLNEKQLKAQNYLNKIATHGFVERGLVLFQDGSRPDYSDVRYFANEGGVRCLGEEGTFACKCPKHWLADQIIGICKPPMMHEDPEIGEDLPEPQVPIYEGEFAAYHVTQLSFGNPFATMCKDLQERTSDEILKASSKSLQDKDRTWTLGCNEGKSTLSKEKEHQHFIDHFDEIVEAISKIMGWTETLQLSTPSEKANSSSVSSSQSSSDEEKGEESDLLVPASCATGSGEKTKKCLDCHWEIRDSAESLRCGVCRFNFQRKTEEEILVPQTPEDAPTNENWLMDEEDSHQSSRRIKNPRPTMKSDTAKMVGILKTQPFLIRKQQPARGKKVGKTTQQEFDEEVKNKHFQTMFPDEGENSIGPVQIPRPNNQPQIIKYFQAKKRI